MSSITPGLRISLRGEDFLVTDNAKQVVQTVGISELVRGMKFSFDLDLEEFEVITPENTDLLADRSINYRQTKLFIETTLRNSSLYSDAIEIADKAAIRGADYQFLPTIMALEQPQPRILIADAVGLGKTVQVGIFLAELIRRGKGQRILVVTPKSILAQFQLEIWSRFSIPLVRLDSQGIAKIKANIPSNKNPFDYYDKVIVSIDTLKNNGKFRHFLEKTFWDVVAIDECHLAANASSQRGGLAKFLSRRTDAMVLTSATPHNGKKENFANLIKLLDPTAIPYDGNFTYEDIKPLHVRRFKKDVDGEVGDAFRKRETIPLRKDLFPEEEEVLLLIQNFKEEAYKEADGNLSSGVLLFSVGLFKGYMSSPEACLETINNRLEKQLDNAGTKDLLKKLQVKLQNIIAQNKDAKFNRIIERLKEMKWKGGKNDVRVIIFSERRATLNALEEKLKVHFKLKEETVIQFHGSLTDVQQREIIDDFSRGDSKVRLFLASDAGSQGVNLHHSCHHMFNYDIPWSIITLDQRNGRIDRFGQNETPYIYYLIANSKNEKVQGDIRILEKLKEKEEEVHKSLGDAGSVWKLFDSNEEEKKVRQAIAKSDVSIIEEKETEEEVDWLDVFSIGSDAQEPVKSQVSFEKGLFSFFKSDYTYYSNLIDEIIEQETEIVGNFLKDEEEEIIEISRGKELSSTGVLYDIPSEAFPPKKENFKLTSRKELVEKAIVNARKKKGDWPKFQLLYDLHPIARWLQFKLLAKVDKGKALVAKMRAPLPAQSVWFVFQGITSNGQGKPILSKTFVVGRNFSGGDRGSLDSFKEFVEEYNLTEKLPALEVSNDEIQKIKSILPDAVNTAKNLYLHKLQGDLEDEMENRYQAYSEKLLGWVKSSEQQLELKFGTQKSGIVSGHKDKRKRDLEHVREKQEKFYEEFFHLENEPFLRLLAVFFNN